MYVILDIHYNYTTPHVHAYSSYYVSDIYANTFREEIQTSSYVAYLKALKQS